MFTNRSRTNGQQMGLAASADIMTEVKRLKKTLPGKTKEKRVTKQEAGEV